jgi:hypothetical protein
MQECSFRSDIDLMSNDMKLESKVSTQSANVWENRAKLEAILRPTQADDKGDEYAGSIKHRQAFYAVDAPQPLSNECLLGW